MVIIDFIVYIMFVIYVVWDIGFLNYVILGLLTLMLAINVLRSIIFSKKTFLCLECGEVFKLKWTELYNSYSTWGYATSVEKIEKDGEEYKILWIRCKKCGMMNVAYKG
jgi:hypothetical protein